ncbi:MAG: TIGR03915 family putative DNA repair protein [Pseudoflavonifractor sp.]|nr:TIGR03915 family putative DNA repair protein [Pseudoflavonifractor sp.]
MTVYRFDGTFEGILTSVFDAFERRCFPSVVIREAGVVPMFCDAVHDVVTDDDKSGRVWRGLEKRLPREVLSVVTTSYLCGLPEFDTTLFNYICKMFRMPKGAHTRFDDPDVLGVTNMCRKVNHERHRVLMFLRFQKAADGTYFAVIEPIYDVLPIAVGHFVDRFSTERFVMYDRRRGYGYYYDGSKVTRVTMPADLAHIATGRLPDGMMAHDERMYQRLWRTYFDAIAIRERENPRKQRQDMPVRFWKYLKEKNGR